MRGGAFYNMKALFLMSDIETKEVYQRIVYAGGGDWRRGDTRDAIADRVDGRHLTHIFADPWILERGSRRYNGFQDWLDYEKKRCQRRAPTISGMAVLEDGKMPAFFTSLTILF